MLTSPVLRYELLTIGRRSRYVVLRSLYVVGLLLALWLCYLEAFGRSSYDVAPVLADYSQLARYFFAAFAGIQLGAILLLTPAAVAGTIAGEHERRTIDYLLTTHLTDAEITFGKLVARLLTLGYQLLAGWPVLALVMLFGGIDPGTMTEVFGYSGLVLLATASLSIWISASSRQSRAAITSSYLIIILLVLLPLVSIAALEGTGYGRSGWLYDVAAVWNLWSPLFLIVASFEGVPTHLEWHRPEYIVPLYLGASALFLFLAKRALRRTATRTPATTGRHAKTKPRRAVGERAMLWKETICASGQLRIGRGGRVATVLLFLAAYAALAIAIWNTIDDELNTGTYGYGWGNDPFGYDIAYARTTLHFMSCTLGGIVGTLVLLLITSRAAGSVTCEKEQDSWLTLLSTTLTAREIVLAKICGAIYSVRYWYLFMVVVWICCAVRFPYMVFTAPLFLAEHLVLGWLCAAVGVYFSLGSPTSLRAIGASVAVMGVVYGAAPMFLLLLLGDGYRSPGRFAIGFLAPMIFGGTDHLFARWFCDESSNFDEVAAVSIFFAVLLYFGAAVSVSAAAVNRFHSLSGRQEAYRPGGAAGGGLQPERTA